MDLKDLSILERQVLWFIAHGKNRFRIAEKMGLTDGVVRVLTDRAQDKLGANYQKALKAALTDKSLRPPRRPRDDSVSWRWKNPTVVCARCKRVVPRESSSQIRCEKCQKIVHLERKAETFREKYRSDPQFKKRHLASYHKWKAKMKQIEKGERKAS